MLKNYIKIAFRNLVKNKVFSLINVLGMTIGMTSFMLIGVYVWDELQYDQHYPDKANTFRIYSITTTDNGQNGMMASVPPTLGPKLKMDFPEVASTLRIMDQKQDLLLTIDAESTYISGAVYAEEEVFDMLAVSLHSGNPATALTKPNQVILSESLAKKIYGDQDPLDETIELSQRPYTITGIYPDFPAHSHLNPPLILSFASFTQYVPEERLNSWIWHQFYTYVKFKQPVDVASFESKLNSMIVDNAPPMEAFGFTYTSYLQNITDIYLHSASFQNELAKRGNSNTLYALMAAALFIIVIVCLNFINLSTTQMMSRMKEVGVRKVIGASRKHVILQFIGESVILSLSAVVLAGFIMEISVSSLNTFLGKQLQTDIFLQPLTVTGLIFFAILLGILAGTYPAVYASRFSMSSLQGNRGSSKGSASFRNTMIVIQFALSTTLIIVSIIVYQQVQFLRQGDLGFDKEHVITIPLKAGLRNNLETTKNKFLEHPNVLSATMAYGLPGDVVAGDNIIQPVGNKTLAANIFMIDHDYISTMGLHLIAGRDFNIDLTTDASEAFVINETAVSALGFSSPQDAIGKPLHWSMWHYDSIKKGEIIGVVRDFNFKSMRDEIGTSILHIYPRSFYKMAMRLKGEQIQETLRFIEKTWKELEPTWPITYSFIDEDFDKMYTSEKRLSTLITLFTGIGIFIACLGLFGLVSYSTQLRIKEIGVRKVMGASVTQVVLLLTRSYFTLLLIAFVLAIPLSVYTMNDWLSGFAYKININLSVFIISIVSIVLIAVISVGYQSIKAALTNPAKVLKNE